MGTNKTATARALIDPEVKKNAEAILKEMGLSVSKSFELFYRQVIAQRGLPFEIHVPNEKTIKAIENSRKGKGNFFPPLKSFLTISEFDCMRPIRRVKKGVRSLILTNGFILVVLTYGQTSENPISGSPLSSHLPGSRGKEDIQRDKGSESLS